jgi:hypothetical protein
MNRKKLFTKIKQHIKIAFKILEKSTISVRFALKKIFHALYRCKKETQKN